MSFCVEPFLSSDFRILPVPDESVSVASGPSVPRDPLAHIVPLLVAFVGTLCPTAPRIITGQKVKALISVVKQRQKKNKHTKTKTHTTTPTATTKKSQNKILQRSARLSISISTKVINNNLARRVYFRYIHKCIHTYVQVYMLMRTCVCAHTCMCVCRLV